MNFTQKALMAFSLAFVCISICANGQTPTPAPPFALRTDLIPPSPNAASLGKYGLVPVSLQTGIPDISVPITTAEGRQLKIPITLNYHHNGLKPAEEASWVGLGWSLQAGGVITRIVKDKVDELITGTNNKYNNVSWRFNTADSITNDFLDGASYLALYDTQPDVYAFNFGQYSGKFILYNGKCYQYPYQQLGITGDPSTGFTIITPDGNQYIFNQIEQTLALNHDNNRNDFSYTLPTRYNTGWFLQSITSPDHKDQINLTYTGPDIIVQNGPGTQNMKVQSIYYTVNPISFPYPVDIYTPRLTKISTSKMYINFNSDTAMRQDVASTPALANIEVYNYSGQLLDRFTFNTSYFSPGGGFDHSRLKLTGIDEGISVQNLKKTRFYYKETNGYPSKKLSSTDHWGYSNGGDISSTAYLMPKRDYWGYPVFPQGIDKTPDSTYARYSMLNKIVYPAGGATVFNYEQNLTNNGLHYVTNAHTMEVDAQRTDLTNTNTVTNYGSFSLNVAQTVKVVLTRQPVDTNATGAIKDHTPQLIISSGTQSYSFTISNTLYNNGYVDSVALQPGTYTMEAQCDLNEISVTTAVNYLQQTNQVIEGIPGPGMRIKAISNYADSTMSVLTSRKQYIYKDSTGVSTGVLLNIPGYGAKPYTENIYQKGFSPVTNQYMTYTSTNGSGIHVVQDMYYNKVYEQTVSQTDTLMSRSTFNLPEAFTDNGTTPFLTSKTDYRRQGSTYVPVKKQVFNYGLVQDSSFFAIIPFMSKRNIITDTASGAGFPSNQLRFYVYDLYTVDPSWLRLSSEKETDYYNTNDSVVVTKNFTYSILRNVTLATTTDSKGLTRVEKSKYRENYGVNVFTPGINSVVERQVWLKRSATDSVLTSGLITQYHTSFYKPLTLYGFESATPVSSLNQETKNANGLYTSLLSDSRYQGRLFNTYETGFGNIVAEDQVTSSDTTHQVNILWGYHNNYPIAQVKNAKISSVAYTSFEDDDNSWTYTSTNVNSTDGKTGTKCYAGTISKSGLKADNYYLTLWAKGSGTITVGGVAKTITGTWAPYQWQLNNITSVTVNSGSILMDEVRLCPVNAEMTTYTYSPQIGVTSSSDAKGQITFFEYDSFQRLMNIKDKDGNIIKSYTYHYQGQ